MDGKDQKGWAEGVPLAEGVPGGWIQTLHVIAYVAWRVDLFL